MKFMSVSSEAPLMRKHLLPSAGSDAVFMQWFDKKDGSTFRTHVTPRASAAIQKFDLPKTDSFNRLFPAHPSTFKKQLGEDFLDLYPNYFQNLLSLEDTQTVK